MESRMAPLDLLLASERLLPNACTPGATDLAIYCLPQGSPAGARQSSPNPSLPMALHGVVRGVWWTPARQREMWLDWCRQGALPLLLLTGLQTVSQGGRLRKQFCQLDRDL